MPRTRLQSDPAADSGWGTGGYSYQLSGGKTFPLIEKEGGALTSVYEYFHQNGYQDLDCTNLQLTVSTLNKKERTLLNIQGYAPFLVLTYQCRSMPQGQVIEVGRTIYRSDKFILEL